MKLSVEVICPKCGNDSFSSVPDPETYVGAVCSRCAHILTDAEYSSLTKDATDQYVRNKLKDLGFRDG